MLKEGTGGNVSLIDTSGKYVTYMRNNKKRRMGKTYIEFIVMETDTIKYDNSVIISELNKKNGIKEPIISEIDTIKYQLNDINRKNIIAINNFNVLQQRKNDHYRTLGHIQIFGSIINQILVFWDANKTYKLTSNADEGKNQFEVKNKWSIGHTMFTILNGVILFNGYIMIKISF